MNAYTGTSRQKQRSGSRTPTPRASLTLDDADSAVVTEDDDSDMAGDDISPDASAAARSPLVQQSLAARANLDPRSLSQLHSALYPQQSGDHLQDIPPFRRGGAPFLSRAPLTPSYGPPAPREQRRDFDTGKGQSNFRTPGVDKVGSRIGQDGAAGVGEGKGKHHRGPGMTAWQKPAVAILPPSSAGAQCKKALTGCCFRPCYHHQNREMACIRTLEHVQATRKAHARTEIRRTKSKWHSGAGSVLHMCA